MGSDSVGGIWNGLDSGNWNWTLTGTGLVSRIDVIELFVDPEQELMFQSRIDVIGLLVDPGPRQLGWTPTAWLESGTELVSRIDVIGLFLDPEQELMFQSRIDVIGLLVDPGPRQLGWTPTAWLESGTELVSRIDVIGLFLDPEQELMFQSLDRCDRTLSGSRTSTAWLDSDCLAGIRLLGWNLEPEPEQKDRIRKVVWEPVGNGSRSLVRPEDSPG